MFWLLSTVVGAIIQAAAVDCYKIVKTKLNAIVHEQPSKDSHKITIVPQDTECIVKEEIPYYYKVEIKIDGKNEDLTISGWISKRNVSTE